MEHRASLGGSPALVPGCSTSSTPWDQRGLCGTVQSQGEQAAEAHAHAMQVEQTGTLAHAPQLVHVCLQAATSAQQVLAPFASAPWMNSVQLHSPTTYLRPCTGTPGKALWSGHALHLRSTK